VISLTRAQSREVDRIAMEDLKIPGIVLMENAARGIADAVLERFPEPDGWIAIVCGPGNNGGDGLAVARHLDASGRAVIVQLATPTTSYREGSNSAVNLAIAEASGIPFLPEVCRLDKFQVVVDGVFGTGLDREVMEPYRSTLEAINASGKPVVAVDLPSGLDADTGEVLGVAVKADLTVTMVAPKVGFTKGQGPTHVGDVVVAGIGIPSKAVAMALGLHRD